MLMVKYLLSLSILLQLASLVAFRNDRQGHFEIITYYSLSIEGIYTIGLDFDIEI